MVPATISRRPNWQGSAHRADHMRAEAEVDELVVEYGGRFDDDLDHYHKKPSLFCPTSCPASGGNSIGLYIVAKTDKRPVLNGCGWLVSPGLLQHNMKFR